MDANTVFFCKRFYRSCFRIFQPHQLLPFPHVMVGQAILALHLYVSMNNRWELMVWVWWPHLMASKVTDFSCLDFFLWNESISQTLHMKYLVYATSVHSTEYLAARQSAVHVTTDIFDNMCQSFCSSSLCESPLREIV
ncbi:hypothetical protein AVEN_89663-1 [Araneus ventricosus]|uniref:Uncharacterized protein n=1 Tax=Araneus ventricosus TaxID=182803 RepID=A0A4Y2EXR9_ARAVE|nr:hypothetical protein AVEN_89663-1 [Araneus ventricosus]